MLRTKDSKELNRKSLFFLIFLDERPDLSLINFPDFFLKFFLLIIQFKEHGYCLLYPVRNNAPLGFEPFDSAPGPKYVEGSQRLEFLTGFNRLFTTYTP